MTVLQRETARGFSTGPIRKFVVGAAMAVVGVAAAFGLSQVIDQETPAELGLTAVERNAIAQSNAAAAQMSAESLARLDQARIDAARQSGATSQSSRSPVATLHAQAPAYAQSAGSPVATLHGQAPAYAQSAGIWTLESELAAIKAQAENLSPAATERETGPR